VPCTAAVAPPRFSGCGQCSTVPCLPVGGWRSWRVCGHTDRDKVADAGHQHHPVTPGLVGVLGGGWGCGCRLQHTATHHTASSPCNNIVSVKCWWRDRVQLGRALPMYVLMLVWGLVQHVLQAACLEGFGDGRVWSGLPAAAQLCVRVCVCFMVSSPVECTLRALPVPSHSKEHNSSCALAVCPQQFVLMHNERACQARAAQASPCTCRFGSSHAGVILLVSIHSYRLPWYRQVPADCWRNTVREVSSPVAQAYVTRRA
jgi:hypothetical protein